MIFCKNKNFDPLIFELFLENIKDSISIIDRENNTALSYFCLFYSHTKKVSFYKELITRLDKKIISLRNIWGFTPLDYIKKSKIQKIIKNEILKCFIPNNINNEDIKNLILEFL